MALPRITPPPTRDLTGASRGDKAVFGLLLRHRALRQAPQGQGEPVLVIPARGMSDTGTAPLRAYLGWLGYDARGWSLGVNRGNCAQLAHPVVELAEAVASERGARVLVVGWSEGGAVAAAAASLRPDVVERAITFGPVRLPREAGGADRPAFAEVRPEALRHLAERLTRERPQDGGAGSESRPEVLKGPAVSGGRDEVRRLR